MDAETVITGCEISDKSLQLSTALSMKSKRLQQSRAYVLLLESVFELAQEIMMWTIKELAFFIAIARFLSCATN